MNLGIALLPKRPKGSYVDKFKRYQIVTNHYKVHLKNFKSVYIYTAKFDAVLDQDNKKLRNEILRQAVPYLIDIIGVPTFSGGNIYTLEKKDDFKQEKSIDIPYRGQYFKLNIKLVKQVRFDRALQRDVSNQKIQLNFLNNMLRNFLRHLKLIEIGKTSKFFDPKTKVDIPNTQMKLYHGYSANFCWLQAGLFLKVDAAVKLVRGQTVLDYIKDLYELHRDKNKEQKRFIVNEELRGKTVMANYGSSMYWRIQQILFDLSIDIHKTKGHELTLGEYYKLKYNKVPREKIQPLLKAKSDREEQDIILIPEFCLMTGLPENFDQRKRREISQYTIRPAHQRKQKIQQLVKRMNRQLKQISPKVISQNLGIQIDEKLTKIEAKTIPVPYLALGDRNYVDQGRQPNFQLFNKPLYSTDVRVKCVCIHFPSFDSYPLEKLFKSTAANLKLDLEMKFVKLAEFSNRTGLADIQSEIEYRSKKDFNIMLLVLPSPLKSQYKKIKKTCILNIGCLTQVVLETTLQKKGFQSIATKILLQISTKVGNVSWIPKMSEKLGVKAMIIGIDSSSDKQSRDKKIIGFCATLNQQYSKFYSTTLVQKTEINIVEKMRELIIEAVSAYTKFNNYPPEQIILLRDGCGTGQLNTIREIEVNECLEALKLVNVPIRLCFIIIDKKVTHKFFGYSRDGRISNPNAGTLINSDVVSNDYDFYLVSQFSNRGTTVPTYYKVIYNDSKLEEGRLQQLLYSQCFNYMNWTGSIKIPAPVQYAKKLCSFVSQYINEKGDKELKDLLYFI